MIGWIKANPLFCGVAAAVLLAIATVAIVSFFDHREREAAIERQDQRKIGTTTERLEHNEEVLNAVQNANSAVINPQPDDVERMRARYDRVRRQDNK